MDVDRLDLVFPLLKQGNDVVVDGDFVVFDHETDQELEDAEGDRLFLILSLPSQSVSLHSKDPGSQRVQICLVALRLDLDENDGLCNWRRLLFLLNWLLLFSKIGSSISCGVIVPAEEIIFVDVFFCCCCFLSWFCFVFLYSDCWHWQITGWPRALDCWIEF